VIVEESTETVGYALGLPTTSRGRSSARTSKNKEFTKFVERVLHAAEVSVTDILVALVYMRRARAHLCIETEDWALHRVFLGSLFLAHKYSNDSTLTNTSWSYATGIFGIKDIGRMEREFLDVLDYELTVSEAEILDLHETLVPHVSPSSQPSAQLHPFFQTSALELAPRPLGGVQLFRTRRVTDDEDDEDDQEDGSDYAESFDGGEVPIAPALDEANSSDEETKVDAEFPVPSSPDTPTSSESSSEPSTTGTSVFSYHPQMVSKPSSTEDDTQRSTISRALWLAGHQLVSTLPTAFSQIAVTA